MDMNDMQFVDVIFFYFHVIGHFT